MLCHPEGATATEGSKKMNIIGHSKQINILQKIIESGKIATTYGFFGISGIGKKATALNFAKAVNCLQDPCLRRDDECNCQSCHKIETGNHPDIVMITPPEKNKNIRIEEIRTLQKDLAYKPYEAKHRFFIIDDAHLMTVSASNALLKNLEESSTHTSFILIATSPKKLLPTIVSRCQKILFSPLTPEDISKILDLPPILARLSQGSLELALSLSESLLDPSKRKELIQNLKTKHPTEWAETLKPEDLNFFKTWYRDLLITKCAPTLLDAIINKDLSDLLQQESQSPSQQELIKKMQVVFEAENRLEFNVNKQLAYEWMMLQLSERGIK